MQSEDVCACPVTLDMHALLLKLYEQRRTIFGFMSWRVRDRSTQEDIFQEACLRFLTSGASFVHFSPAAKYFYRIVSNLISGNARASRLEFPAWLPEAGYNPQPDWDTDMLWDRVCEASQGLTPDDRRVLGVCFSAQHPRLRDQVRALNMPSSTLRYRKARIVQKLRRKVVPRIPQRQKRKEAGQERS